MLASFLSLPSELRNEIYKHLLVCREPVRPWNAENKLTTNLLFTNTTVLREASSLLYGNNCFDLTAWNAELIIEFLDAIGFINASYLQYIRIDFLGLRDLGDEVSLEEGIRRILGKIQSHCTNLKSLTITPLTTYLMECMIDSFDSPVKFCRALALVASQFRTITSLQEIIVEVRENRLSSDIRRKMQSHGWTLKVVELVEKEERDDGRDLDEIEDDDYPYDDDDDDD
ncbi:uncharacterized protein N7484_006017 [Penicillium longicatenatum]|uniref:uncharacterized protein n=1 Tax=Penicillium longicatenatum TaxID=1561947 RepID=UPI0025473050|nr:uncharacterized protein N7484_006017 [Penicillium longicatenatum]KAJ5643510.1 hypothetical protein N7484_006017 [Penicillium longicatenatum]